MPDWWRPKFPRSAMHGKESQPLWVHDWTHQDQCHFKTHASASWAADRFLRQEFINNSI